MSVMQSVLLGLLAATLATQTAPREYTSDELPQLVADFQLDHELFDNTGMAVTNGVVRDIVLVRINAPGGRVGTHDLVIYRDNRPVGSRSGIRFPYVFHWNFGGLTNGPHMMLLVFTNAKGEKGLVRVEVTVQH